MELSLNLTESHRHSATREVTPVFQFTTTVPTLSERRRRRRFGCLTVPLMLVVLFSCPLPKQCAAQTPREISAASYVERAKGFVTQGDFKRAIADFDIALQFDP